MSVTFGFYNSINHDRVYDAEQFSSIFDGIIRDGVFDTIGDCFEVTPSTGMKVLVGSGRAWFNNTWTLNDDLIEFTLDSTSGASRCDAIILEVDKNSNVRANSIKVKKGSNANKPAMIQNNGLYQYPLAYITMTASTVQITESNIEITVGTDECPWVQMAGELAALNPAGEPSIPVYINSNSIATPITAPIPENLGGTGVNNLSTFLNYAGNNTTLSITDLDQIRLNGSAAQHLNSIIFIARNSEIAHRPTEEPGHLINIGRGNYSAQIFIELSLTSHKSYFRKWNGTSWSSWDLLLPSYTTVGDSTTPIYIDSDGIPQATDVSAFVSRKTLDGITDLNNIDVTGWWWIPKSVADQELNLSHLPMQQGGYLVCYRYNENYKVQIYYPSTTSVKYYVRIKHNGTWYDWQNPLDYNDFISKKANLDPGFDLNNISESGWWYLTTNYINSSSPTGCHLPISSNGNATTGYLVCYRFNENYACQVFYENRDNTAFHYRVEINGTWSDWERNKAYKNVGSTEEPIYIDGNGIPTAIVLDSYLKKKDLGSLVNANSLDKTGWWWIPSNLQNPLHFPTDTLGGYLIAYAYSDNYVLQQYFSSNGSEFWYRYKHGGTWRNWVSVKEYNDSDVYKKKDLGTVTNMNSLTDSGWFWITNAVGRDTPTSTTHLPVQKAGYLVCFAYSDQYLMQQFFPSGNSSFYIRYRVAGTWNNWLKYDAAT